MDTEISVNVINKERETMKNIHSGRLTSQTKPETQKLQQ